MKIGIYAVNNSQLKNIYKKIYIHNNNDAQIHVACREIDNNFMKDNLKLITKENTDELESIFGHIDMLHICYDGYFSMRLCEQAVSKNIPVVLQCQYLSEINWENQYFNLFSKYVMLTLLNKEIVNSVESQKNSIIIDEKNEKFGKMVYHIILEKYKSFMYSSKPTYLDLLKCGDKKCVKNVLEALKNFGELNDTLRLLNYGGQGLVYTMFSNKVNKMIAIKVPNYPRRKEKHYLTMERTLLKEARLLEDCNNLGTNYVPEQYCYDANGKYVVKEYIDGECMTEVLHSQEDIQKILKDFVKMSEELFFVFHEQLNVVIKDFKPRNIIVERKFFSESNNYKLIDIGSSLAESKIKEKIRKENLPKLGVGQYLHWPPELLLENFEQCGRRIDYFSFGVTCYLIITGKYPYSNTERNVENVYHKYFEEYSQATELLKEHSKNLSISSDLLDFIIECLNPLVSERPQKWYRQDFILKKKSKI